MCVYNEQYLWVRLTFDSQADLIGHVSHLADGVGQVIVFFEEVESAESQQLKTDTHMAVIVEPVKHLHTQAENEEKTCVYWSSARFICAWSVYTSRFKKHVFDSLFIFRILFVDSFQYVNLQPCSFFVLLYVFDDL